MQDLSDTLREISERYGWNQSELAAAFGVSQPTISRIMRGLPVRSGPAIKRINQGLTAVSRRPGGVENAEDKYSLIQEGNGRVDVFLQRFLRHSPNEADALDKLLTAIEDYVVARSQAGN